MEKSLERVEEKFLFNVEDLISFIFPNTLQHPLAAARLVIFGLYGPFDENGKLRSGRKGSHILLEYELDAMCTQVEREDLIQVYLQKSRDLGMLTLAEQDAIINQADAHLKVAKGRAMLPQITADEVRQIFKDFPKDGGGRINFHDAQLAIENFRNERIGKYKLMYPTLANNAQSNSATTNQKDTKLLSKKLSSQFHHQKFVSTAIAPQTMFERNKGNTNADLIDITSKQLGKHGFKIIDLDAGNSVAVTSNVKLLRELYPKYDDPKNKVRWNDKSIFKGSGIGSMVDTIPSNTTWKRKFTSY